MGGFALEDFYLALHCDPQWQQDIIGGAWKKKVLDKSDMAKIT